MTATLNPAAVEIIDNAIIDSARSGEIPVADLSALGLSVDEAFAALSHATPEDDCDSVESVRGVEIDAWGTRASQYEGEEPAEWRIRIVLAGA